MTGTYPEGEARGISLSELCTPKIFFLVSLSLAALPESAVGKASYENFNLPKKEQGVLARTPPNSNEYSYVSPRVQLKRKASLSESSTNAQQYLFAKEAYVAEKRDEAIKLLRQELDSGYSKNRDNILIRLGQLYAEKYMELSYRENEMFTERLNEYEKTKATNKNAKAPKIDNERSQRYLKMGLNIFQTLEKEYPNHPKIDEITYFIGFVEMETGNTAKGIKYLDRVVREFPRSRKHEESVIYLGDYYFEKAKFRDALTKYKVILSRKNAALYHYALYKIAWCELNTLEPKKAIADMKTVITELAGSKEVSKFNLREQALRDLVIFYGEVGMVDEAIAYFTEVQGREKAIENLKLIAEILKSKARDDAAVRAYSKLLQEFPDTPETPKLYLGMYESLQRMGKTEEAVATIIKCVENYGPNSAWAKKFPPEKSADVKSSIEAVGAEAQRIAFFYHNSAQKSSNKSSYEHALRLYRALLTYYPQHPERKKIAFYKGEILYAQGKWLEAADSYMIAAQTPPKDKVADEAAYDALLALDRLTANNDNLERYNKEDQKKVDLTPEAIPANEKRFIEVAEFYMREYPQGQRIVDVKFRIAAIYYRHHHFDKSQELFREIALKNPKHRSATTAAHIVLDIYNIKKDYVSLDANANLFAKTEGLGDAKFKAEMAQISGEIGFKKIESFEASNKWKDAGDAYYEYYKKNPNSPLAEKSLYNAFISYEKANDSAKAAETSRLFISKYPKSQYTQRFMLNLARLAEKQYDFEQAQKLYQDYHVKFPKDKESRKALYNAAVFAELTEKNRLAMQLYDEYLKTGAVSADEKKSIVISQAKIYRKEGNWDKVTQTYRRLIRDAKSVEEKLTYLGELGRLYERGGRTQERNQILNEIRWLYEGNKGIKASGPAIGYVAEARFRAVAPQREKYDKIELRFPPEDLLYLMNRKSKLLTKLATSYDNVVEVGVPEWGVAALYEKADAFDSFVRNFKKVQIPGKYRGEERAEIEKQLKAIEAKLVTPLETKYQEILKACAGKASEFYVANEYATKCRDRMQKTGQSVEPGGLLPQPAYWTTRWSGSEGVARP